MTLPDIPLVVLDTETTGFVPRTHQVIEFASVRTEGGKIVDEYEQLFFAEEVPPHVEVLTRIRTLAIQTAPLFASKRDEVASHIPEGALIVGQNIPFDIGMLKGEGIDLTERPWIDTSMLASLVFPELESYSLQYLSTVLTLNHSPKHRALGDVHATLELLSRCWERLLELTPAMQEEAMEIMAKGSEGYRRLFSALPPATARKKPAWLKASAASTTRHPLMEKTAALNIPDKNHIGLREEPLDPGHLFGLIAMAEKSGKPHWFAVKNIDAYIRRLPENFLADKEKEGVRVLYPPSHLLDRKAADLLRKAATLTADEALLSLKIAWYSPKTRNDFPLHGGEEAVWNGKLACTETSEQYLKQLQNPPHVLLLDHRQLLRFLETPDHPAQALLLKSPHVVIDDASMLEDTATKAYGWMVGGDELRAASEGDPLLTHFTDVLQLWIEKVRQEQDIRYLGPPDLTSSEARGLREELQEVAAKEHPLQVAAKLNQLALILEPANLATRLAWIERRPNGGQILHSVPERISSLLAGSLYARTPTTLLIPPGSGETLCEILPDAGSVDLKPISNGAGNVPITFPIQTLESIFQTPPEGKTIVLLSGKGPIENAYVRHAESLEARGIALICQGINGGQGRMRAEFLAAKAPALWLITPWTFEGLDLPPKSIDHLFLTQLPFDYYSHPVLSRRSAHYKDPFIDYFFPRLLHRLFRILRTFCRFRKEGADMRILDDRIRTKGYGKDVVRYLSRFSSEEGTKERSVISGQRSEAPESKSKEKKPTKNKNESQLKMF